jgi:hypothetical protein
VSERHVGVTFREGDEIVLAEGTYQGATGVFIRLREDVNWAEIRECNGAIRSHPVAWLAHSTGTITAASAGRSRGSPALPAAS